MTAEEMALHQPKSVKEALSYTHGVAVGTRGASNTYDYLIIRGFAADGQSQNNFLNGLKMQGNFYNDAVIDPICWSVRKLCAVRFPYFTERAARVVC